jgi:hypothetical protein
MHLGILQSLWCKSSMNVCIRCIKESCEGREDMLQNWAPQIKSCTLKVKEIGWNGLNSSSSGEERCSHANMIMTNNIIYLYTWLFLMCRWYSSSLQHAHYKHRQYSTTLKQTTTPAHTQIQFTIERHNKLNYLDLTIMNQQKQWTMTYLGVPLIATMFQLFLFSYSLSIHHMFRPLWAIFRRNIHSHLWKLLRLQRIGF